MMPTFEARMETPILLVSLPRAGEKVDTQGWQMDGN